MIYSLRMGGSVAPPGGQRVLLPLESTLTRLLDDAGTLTKTAQKDIYTHIKRPAVFTLRAVLYSLPQLNYFLCST